MIPYGSIFFKLIIIYFNFCFLITKRSLSIILDSMNIHGIYGGNSLEI